AVNLGNRAAVVYSQNDLAGAWERDESGAYAYEVSPGGEPQRELAVRGGINVCMYALCLDYKDDTVHLPLIPRKRGGTPAPPPPGGWSASRRSRPGRWAS